MDDIDGVEGALEDPEVVDLVGLEVEVLPQSVRQIILAPGGKAVIALLSIAKVRRLRLESRTSETKERGQPGLRAYIFKDIESQRSQNEVSTSRASVDWRNCIQDWICCTTPLEILIYLCLSAA